MPSRKQQIYAELMGWLIPLSRGPLTCGRRRRFWHGAQYRRVFEDLELIHGIPLSILDEEYGDHDIWFANCSIKQFVESGKGSLTPLVARMLLESYDGVPATRKHELTWHPPENLRHLAEVDVSENPDHGHWP